MESQRHVGNGRKSGSGRKGERDKEGAMEGRVTGKSEHKGQRQAVWVKSSERNQWGRGSCCEFSITCRRRRRQCISNTITL